MIEAALANHSYAHLFAELPRIGVANFGQVIAEVGPLLERGATADQLAGEVAMAPQLYRAARDRGKPHPHAARIIGRAWLRVIHACWRNQTPYDPHRRRPLAA